MVPPAAAEPGRAADPGDRRAGSRRCSVGQRSRTSATGGITVTVTVPVPAGTDDRERVELDTSTEVPALTPKSTVVDPRDEPGCRPP